MGTLSLWNHTPVVLTYDEYKTTLDLSYWWKLGSNFVGGDPNNGVAGAVPLVVQGSGVGLTYEQATIVSGTVDQESLKSTGNSWSWLNANSVRVDGTANFTAGGWFNIATTAEDQLLFRSNMGGKQGYWRGVDVLQPNGSDRLVIVLGTNSTTGGKYYYRLITPAAKFPRNAVNFWSLFVEPTADPATIGLTLCINGVQVSLTYFDGTGDTVAWPVTASVPNGWNGIAFGAAGDTYGGRMQGTWDEVFFHWGEITPAQHATLYELGTV